MSGYPQSDSPVETIEAIIDVVQLPENEENIVEDQPTEAVDSDTDDNENQEDFSEEIEDENTESSLENEDYPGEDVVEIINLRGETTTVYKLVDGRYMDCTNTVYIYCYHNASVRYRISYRQSRYTCTIHRFYYSKLRI